MAVSQDFYKSSWVIQGGRYSVKKTIYRFYSADFCLGLDGLPDCLASLLTMAASDDDEPDMESEAGGPRKLARAAKRLVAQLSTAFAGCGRPRR